MNLWMKQRKLALQVIQKCFCQRSNILSQITILSPHTVRVSYCNKYSMSSISSISNNSTTTATSLLQNKNIELTAVSEQHFSSSNENQETAKTPELSKKDKLKRAVKDYGATVIVFHVTISLMSLGLSYLVISSGVDVASLLSKVGLDTKSDLAAGASTFVVAYAVHKMFAPVRISITLGATPFIVRYLRRVGILKPPKSANP